MSIYLIGDIHGCYNSLKNILNIVSFNPKNDILWLTGDLVAKGPQSLKVLNLVYNIRDSVKIVLGNHDLHLLKLYFNFNHRNQKKNIQNTNILQSSHFKKIFTWLRHQPIMQIDEEKKIIMTHAGIHPTWDINRAKKYAQDIENILKSKNYPLLLSNNIPIKKKHPSTINIVNSNNLLKTKLNINIFTRMRYLFPNGDLDLEYKGIPEATPSSLQPWFNVPGLISPHYNIIFGHWSSLKGRKTPTGIYGLDSGCYQGEKLTLLQWENKKFTYVSCNLNAL